METVEELKAKLRLAEQVEKDNERATYKQLQAEWKKITDDKNNWLWSAEPTDMDDYILNKRLKGVRLSCIVKPEVVQKWADEHGGSMPPANRELHWNGMMYYRTPENILTHSGGGSHVLDSEPKLCSDEQWAELCAGRVPDKFRGNWLGGK